MSAPILTQEPVGKQPGLVLYSQTARNVDRNIEVSVYSDMVQVVQRTAPGKKSGKAKVNQTTADIAMAESDDVDVFVTLPPKMSTFSRKSRLNMQRSMAKNRNTDRGLFFTLNYPDSVAGDPDFSGERVKRDMKTFEQRLQRRYPGVGGIWRKEYKDRQSGALIGEYVPHFHLLTFGIMDDLAAVRKWTRQAWYEIAHDGDQHQGKAGYEVSPVKSRRHANYYLSKYLGKHEDGICEILHIKGWFMGRHWATFGQWDTRAIQIIKLTHRQLVELRRLSRRFLKSRRSAYAKRMQMLSQYVGFSIFSLGFQSHPMFGFGVDDRIPTIWMMLEQIEAV